MALLLIRFIKYGIVQLLLPIYEYLEKSPNCVYIPLYTPYMIINLHEQYVYTVVQFSDLAKNWQFCTPIIVNIVIHPPLDPKTFDIQRIVWNYSKRLWLQKIGFEVGAYVNYEKIAY